VIFKAPTDYPAEMTIKEANNDDGQPTGYIAAKRKSFESMGAAMTLAFEYVLSNLWTAKAAKAYLHIELIIKPIADHIVAQFQT
jgi:hypothetical protein